MNLAGRALPDRTDWLAMPEIPFEESVRQVNELVRRAEQRRKAGEWQEAVDRFRAVLAHPCAHHQVVDEEILEEIHQALRQAGRWDDAIAAKREAIAAGFRSIPDPEADIAECLLSAGRRQEADALFAELRGRDPEDVWLYNSAAFAYGGIDDREALRWSLDGIETALATGDPDQVVMQLLEWAEAGWTALGEPVDRAVVDRIEAFCEAWKPGPRDRRWDDLDPIEERPCAYCGYDPERTRDDQAERARRHRRRLLEAEDPEALARLDRAFSGPEETQRLPRALALAVAWFPPGEWLVAVERWPDLLDELPFEHQDYSHAIEARVKRLARHAAGHPMHVSPLTVGGLDEQAAVDGEDAGSAELRASFAAEVLRRGEAVSWPPGRNDPCWCRSGRKYKRCCGPVPAAEDDPVPS